jgi:hypothetical protein
MRLRIRSLMGLIALIVLTGAMAMAQNGNIITCSSNDGQLHSCRVDSNQQIQFVRQRSDAQCIEGQTYGINRGGVWVTNGCRADFAIGNTDQAYNNGHYNQQGTYNNGGYSAQNNDRDRDGYRDQNGNWHARHHRDRDNDHDNNGYSSQNGTNNNGTYNRQGTYQGPYNNGSYANGGYVGQGQQHPTVYYGKYDDGKTTCTADRGTGPVYCQTNGALSDATILKQNGSCQRGQNWDINPDGLWVADGCSAQFKIQR